MNDEEAPMDATAMQAEEIVKAALAWRWEKGSDPLLVKTEWRLFQACDQYGSKFKGVRGQ